MARIENLKKALSVVRVDGVPSNLSCVEYPECEAGYLRGEYDDLMWWTGLFPVNRALWTDELSKEFGEVAEAFFRAFEDRDAMGCWCRENLELAPGFDWYTAYYAGEYGAYRLMMKNCPGDYNLYIHCYSKEGN